jgi:kumamolisin
MTREEFEAAHGADPKDIQAVRTFARQHGLEVVEASAPRRTVVLAGTVAQMQAAFGVQLGQYEHPGGTYRGREGEITLPAELQPVVEGVFGLDDRPQADPHLRMPERTLRHAQPHAAGASFTPPQLAQIYSFPSGDGKGQAIALIELGGGYRPADLQTYFTSVLGLKAPPKVVSVGVDHARNHATGNPNGDDGEVVLDIEVAGGVAPGATIVVYFAPNTDRGFLDAITTAIHDAVHKPSVISISWGGPEKLWTAQAMKSFDQAFQTAAALGVTVCVASGDDGSSDGVNDGHPHADFPASSPNVLACGGTHLTARGAKISSEVVWNDGATGGASGGGFSAQFPPPAYQAKALPSKAAGRGVPDVAGDASPQTGYVVRVDGQATVLGGTSAVAPLWAGLVARLNQQLGRPLGFLNAFLYLNAPLGGVHDITRGNNGAFQATAGWDPCTGLGSPNGQQLLQLLTPHAAPAPASTRRRKPWPHGKRV